MGRTDVGSCRDAHIPNGREPLRMLACQLDRHSGWVVCDLGFQEKWHQKGVAGSQTCDEQREGGDLCIAPAPIKKAHKARGSPACIGCPSTRETIAVLASRCFCSIEASPGCTRHSTSPVCCMYLRRGKSLRSCGRSSQHPRRMLGA